jgi:hypothetical protein
MKSNPPIINEGAVQKIQQEWPWPNVSMICCNKKLISIKNKKNCYGISQRNIFNIGNVPEGR